MCKVRLSFRSNHPIAINVTNHSSVKVEAMFPKFLICFSCKSPQNFSLCIVGKKKGVYS